MATKRKSSKSAAKRRSQGKADAATTKPTAMRPVVPASYRFPTSPKGLLDWTWAQKRLTESYNYVIVTVRPDGRPHAMGMHGLWAEDAYYFGTHPATRKAKNLEVNANCVVICEKMEELVIVEGVAEKVSYDQLPLGLSDTSEKKYGWPIDPRRESQVYKVTPRVVFAFPLKQIARAVTKWVFE